jgi:hypothetical protein
MQQMPVLLRRYGPPASFGHLPTHAFRLSQKLFIPTTEPAFAALSQRFRPADNVQRLTFVTITTKKSFSLILCCPTVVASWRILPVMVGTKGARYPDKKCGEAGQIEYLLVNVSPEANHLDL